MGSETSPFVRPVVRRIIERLFSEKDLWKSGELVDRVVQAHRDAGGSVVPNPNFTIIRALRWTRAPEDGSPAPEEKATDSCSAVDEKIDDIEPAIRPEKEIGNGLECVYLYFNPNDRRLAELEGRDIWECKIGRTSSRDAMQRIWGQGIRTSLSHLPTVGLVFRTDDSSALENALHSSLRLVGAEVPDSPGNEWFITSPALVEAWYESFQSTLATLRTSIAEPG